MNPYRIGVLGLHHDHVWGNLEELDRTERAEIVGAADPFPSLREKFSSTWNAPTYSTYEELLSRSDELDAVYVFASNQVSEDLTIAACDAGLHCLVEKPMAATLAGADKMLAAAREKEVRLFINWPFAWWPQLRHAIDLALEGRIGKVWQVKYRAAHQGPVELGCSTEFCDWLYDAEKNGAGALMDYCCYGAVLAQVILGTPTSVTGAALRTGLKPDLSLEDNAILILRYPDAIATTEASWTQIGSLTSYGTVIYGSEGTLVVDPDHGGTLRLATSETPEGGEIEIPSSPAYLETASTHFLACLDDTSLPIHPLCQAEHGRQAQWILEKGLQSLS